MKKAIAFSISLLLTVFASAAERSNLLEFDSIIARSTFKLQSGNSVGTGFVLLHPDSIVTNSYRYVLITAAHVLVNMAASNVTIHTRVQETNGYRKQPHEIRIRAYGTNLWVQHPRADVAAMVIELPVSADLGNLRTDLIADDKFFEDFVIHPGDELRVYGYPYGYEANPSGFPILRSGRIASFPLIPSSRYPTYLLDFRVFPGNSGGPVYILENRQMEQGALTTVRINYLMGLISEQAAISERLTGLTEEMVKTHQLGLGIVIHPKLIIETIEMIPALKSPPTVRTN